MPNARLRLVAVLLAVAASLAAACVNAPPESRRGSGDEIRFESRSGIAKANGIFHDWRVVRARVDASDPGASEVEIEIDVASIDTGSEGRDDHMRDWDYFDAEKWPHARVRVHDARPVADEPGIYDARFDLAIRDRRHTLDGRFSVVSERPLVVEGGLTLDRTQFGVGPPEGWWKIFVPADAVPVRFRVTLEDGG